MLKRVSPNGTACEEAVDWSKTTATAGGEGEDDSAATENLVLMKDTMRKVLQVEKNPILKFKFLLLLMLMRLDVTQVNWKSTKFSFRYTKNETNP
jgi:hypothetical protein